MCDCINKLEKKMIGREIKKKKIVKAKYLSSALMFDNQFILTTTSEIELTLEGRAKPFKQLVVHSHCPFCGKPYPKR